MKGNFMKVVVSVLSGRNKGKVYDLTEPPNGEAHYVLCEDDVLEFRVQTGVNVQIFIWRYMSCFLSRLMM